MSGLPCSEGWGGGHAQSGAPSKTVNQAEKASGLNQCLSECRKTAQEDGTQDAMDVHLFLSERAYGTSKGRIRGVKWGGMRWCKDEYKREKVEGLWVKMAGCV